jgi:prepilin-type N-terminal cleavage/methylation domain-containing protein
VERVVTMKRRLGFTLIEIVAALAVTSVLLAIAAGLLHALFRFQEGGQERLRQRVAMDRLARQFREDVHAASGLTAEGVGSPSRVGADASEPSKPLAPDAKKTPDPFRGWRLQLAGSRTIEYRVESDALARSEREGDKPVWREGFPLPPGAKVEVKLREDKGAAMASLRITAGGEPAGSGAPPVLLVEGVLGLDHRFTAPAGGASKSSEGKPSGAKK